MLKIDFKKEKLYLFFIFIFSLLIRFVFFIFFIKNNPVIWRFDSHVYKIVAKQISLGLGFSNLDGSAHFYRMPGYSYFLSLTSLNNNFLISLLIQLFLASFIPILVYYLSKTLFSKSIKLAFISSIYSSIHLGFILFSGLAMTESIFSIFFLLFLIFFYKQKYLLAGIFLGLSSYFRPVGHYLIIVAIFLIFFLFKDKLRASIKIFLSWLIILFPWLLRNFLLTGYIFLTTLSGIHFLKHSAARINMELQNIDYKVALDEVSNEWQKSIKSKSLLLNRPLYEIEKCNLAEGISKKYFLKNYFLTFKHVFTNMFKTFFSLYSSELMFLDSNGKLPEYSNSRSIFSILKRFLFPMVNNKILLFFIYYEILLFLLLLIGFLGFIISAIFYTQNFLILLKTLPFIGLFVFITLSCGFARLRLPIEPILIILSFEFWLNFLKKRKTFFYE